MSVTAEEAVGGSPPGHQCALSSAWEGRRPAEQFTDDMMAPRVATPAGLVALAKGPLIPPPR